MLQTVIIHLTDIYSATRVHTYHRLSQQQNGSFPGHPTSALLARQTSCSLESYRPWVPVYNSSLINNMMTMLEAV